MVAVAFKLVVKRAAIFIFILVLFSPILAMHLFERFEEILSIFCQVQINYTVWFTSVVLRLCHAKENGLTIYCVLYSKPSLLTATFTVV